MRAHQGDLYAWEPSATFLAVLAVLQDAGIAVASQDTAVTLLIQLRELILAVSVRDRETFDRAYFDHLMACWDELDAEQLPDHPPTNR